MGTFLRTKLDPKVENLDFEGDIQAAMNWDNKYKSIRHNRL